MTDLRTQIIKLATAQPELRVHLVPLLRKEAIEFTSPGALKTYLERHPNADKSNHSVKDQAGGGGAKTDKPVDKKPEAPPPEIEHEQTEAPEAEDLGSRVKAFVAKFKNAKKDIVAALHDAPKEVQHLWVDSSHRAKTFAKMAEHIRKSPKTIAQRLLKSTHSEIHEIKHAMHAAKKLFKKPPGPFDKKDKQALYSAGAYIAGGVLAAVPPGGAIMAAGALGHSFAMHVGIKAVHEVLDKGFLHYEWAESVFHVLHHIASVPKLAGENDGEDDGEDPEGMEEFTEGLTRVIADILAKGVPDDDLEEVMNASATM